MSEPSWLTRAKRYIGQKEVPGKHHNHLIVSMWKRLGLPYREDETPWCAAFVGSVLELEGIRSTRSAAARSYQSWGTKLGKPIPGCIVVFWRGKRNGFAGHVGFVTRVTKSGHLVVLGGNQGDAVNEKAFAPDRVLSYRWPAGRPIPTEELQVSEGSFELSTNEA